MTQRGLSLVEVRCSAAIVAAIAAILTPVLQGAVLAAKQSGSIGNLRQIHIGMSLYREAHDPKVEFGRPSLMGLPPNPIVWNRSGGWKQAVADPRTWRTPCRPGIGNRRYGQGKPFFTDYALFMDEITNEPSSFEQMCLAHGSQTVYVVEPWCDPSPKDP